MKRTTLIVAAAFTLAAFGSAFAGGEGQLTDVEAAKAGNDATAKKEAAGKVQTANQAFWNSKILPLKEQKEYGKAVEEVKTYLKENPDMSVDIKAGLLMSVSMMDAMDKLDVAAAMAVIDAVAKAYPESQIGKKSDQIKESFKGRIEFLVRRQKELQAKPEPK